MKRIMQDVKVVEVAAWTYVPMAGAILAEWGADVIKVEHPETGDPQRGLVTSGLLPLGPGGVNFMIELPNRGKRSVGIDLKSEKGREILLELVKGADVFLTSLLPQARRELGIDVEDLRAVNPKLIYVRGSAHGQRGPEAERGGYDFGSYWARGGSADIISDPDDYPTVQPGPAYGDVISAMTVAGGVSSALYHREHTGEALVVDNSLLATGMWAAGATILMAGLFGFERMPRGDRTKAPNPLVLTYRTKDRRYISLIMLAPDKYWPDLVTKLGRPELADDPLFADSASRAKNGAECIAILDEIFATRTLEEWKPVLLELKGVWAPVQTASEVFADPQAIANDYLRDVEAASGTTFKLVASPLQFDGEAPEPTRAPDHGEHTDEVLQELGLDIDAILELKIAGAIL